MTSGKQIITCAISAAILAGCSATNTGEITFRRADPAGDVAQAAATYRANCIGTYGAASGETAEGDCRPMLEARLDRQNSGFGRPILTGDVYSIRLDRGVIADISELPFPLSRPSGSGNPFRPTGEIVVLANVFEFGSANPEFLDPTDLTQAKVVYFSEDVFEHQDLNFSNIPLQAPVAYSGNPIGIQLIVVELDRTSGPTQALLGRLADLGSTGQFLPGGATDTLLDLGAALLQQNHDDMIFEYRMVLDPGTTGVQQPSSPFEEGRYVIMRNEARTTELPWNNYRLDHETGRVYFIRDGAPVALADHTYFTVNVIKHPAGTQASNYVLNSFEEFNTSFEASISNRDQALNIITERIQGEIVDARAVSWRAQLSETWNNVSGRANLYSSYVAHADDTNLRCELLPVAMEERDIAEQQAFNAALSFITLYGTATAETTDGTANSERVLSDDEQREILMLLASYFVPFDGSPLTREILANPTQFQQTFANASTFAEAVLTEARRDEETSTCSVLIADGKARAVAAGN